MEVSQGRRKLLVEMATGTGKTRTAGGVRQAAVEAARAVARVGESSTRIAATLMTSLMSEMCRNGGLALTVLLQKRQQQAKGVAVGVDGLWADGLLL